jgi:Exocyst complex component Sec8 C-terminal
MLTARLVPVVEFDLPKDSLDMSLSDENKTRQTRLDRFLIHLNLRTNNESHLELLDDSIEAILAGRSSHVHPGPPPSYNTSGINGASNGSSSAPSSSISAPENPESDSFTYIETLLEALAALGKLVGALDTVVNRLPVELYNLIELTIDEVNDRSEFARPNPASGVNGISTVSPGANSTGYVLVEDHETLRDIFWTLYSKLNAVLQSFRVTYEVANRIGQVGALVHCMTAC